MPFPIQYPQVNGHRYTFNSCQFRFNGVLFIGVKSHNYKPSLKGGIVRGTSPMPLGSTVGDAEFTGDVEMLRLEFNQLLLLLGAPVVGYGETRFTITTTLFEFGSPVTLDTCIGCRIEEPDSSNASGTDPTTVKFSYVALAMLHNGAPIVSPRFFGV